MLVPVEPGVELPYHAGDPVPPGYRLHARPRHGLIVGGSVLGGVPWALGVTAAVTSNFDDNTGYLFVPVLGPWLVMISGGAEDNCGVSDVCTDRSFTRMILALDGLAQAAGAILIIVGVHEPERLLVRERIVGVGPARLGRDGYGMSVHGSF